MITDSAMGRWLQVEFFKCQFGIFRHKNRNMLIVKHLHILSQKQVLDRPPSTDSAVRRARQLPLWEKWDWFERRAI